MRLSRKKTFKECRQFFSEVKKQYREAPPCITSDNPFIAESVRETYPLHKRYQQGGLDKLRDLPASQAYYHDTLFWDTEFIYLGEAETKMGLKHGIVLRDPTRDKDILSFCYSLPYHYFAYKGIPRWLVREGMKSKIPAYILEDWQRYGLQNSDWVQRIQDNWEQIYPLMQHAFQKEGLDSYLPTDLLLSTLQEHRENHFSSYTDMLYLSICYVLSLYLDM